MFILVWITLNQIKSTVEFRLKKPLCTFADSFVYFQKYLFTILKDICNKKHLKQNRTLIILHTKILLLNWFRSSDNLKFKHNKSMKIPFRKSAFVWLTTKQSQLKSKAQHKWDSRRNDDMQEE